MWLAVGSRRLQSRTALFRSVDLDRASFALVMAGLVRCVPDDYKVKAGSRLEKECDEVRGSSAWSCGEISDIWLAFVLHRFAPRV
jgi:hypothetical protein